MKGDPLPAPDHVSRHCKFTWLDENGAVTSSAFLLEPSHEYISVFWLERTSLANRLDQIQEVRNRMIRCGRHLGRNSKLAIVSVGDTTAEIADVLDREIQFRHEPGAAADGLDDAHAGIYGIRADDDLVAELIVRRLILELHPANAA